MKLITKLLVTGMMAVFCCSIAKAQVYTNTLTVATLIYSNNFSGSGSVNITNTPANYEAGVLGGVSGSNWLDAAGPYDTNAFYANGTVGTAQGDAIILPFAPLSNMVYTLQATMTFSASPGTWIGDGFVSYNTNLGLSGIPDERFNTGGVDWALVTESSENVQGEANTTQTANTNGIFGSPIGVPHTCTIILDTTSNKWVDDCLLDGVPCLGTIYNGVYHWAANPIIRGVGLDENGGIIPSDYVWNSFVLFGSHLALLQQPISATSVNEGANYTNSVLAGGGWPFYYQWYTNGVALVNATNATLIINTVTNSMAGNDYYCVVTNAFGAVTSSPASLGVYTFPQFLTANPITYTNLMTLFGGTNIEGTNYLGSTPTFSVYAAGLVPMSYFWLTNGVPVGGANGTTFVVTNCQLSGPTSFTCIASNILGTVTNSWAAQYIPTPTAPYPQLVIAAGPVAYWRLDETNYDSQQYNYGEVCNDFMSGNNGFYTNTALYQPGYYVITNGVPFTNDPTETSAQFGPYDSSTGCDANSMGTNIDFSAPTNAEFSVSCWANGGYGYGGAEAVNGGIVIKGYYGTEEYGLDDGASSGDVRFFIRTAANTVVGASSTFQLGGNNTWHHLVGVCDETNGLINLYIDGLLAAQTAVTKGSGVLPQPTEPITIGASTTPGTLTGDHQFDGALDDVAIFNYPLSSVQVNQLYQAAGGVNPLTFVAPFTPTNIVWRQNQTLTIPAFALGKPTLGYYWYNVTGGTNIGGAGINGGSGVSSISSLTCTLTITNASPIWSGAQLELVVTNSTGSTNLFVTLFSYPPPITIGYTNSILYSNEFDGGTWNLAGTAPTLANTLVGGTNSTWIDVLGTNNTAIPGMYGSGLDNTTFGDSWILPFTPEPGYVYTITASAYMTGFPGSWIGTGFAGPVTNNVTTAAGARFADPSIYGYSTLIWVINTGNVEFLQGPGSAFYIFNQNNVISTSTPITHTGVVVLDTTGPQWVEYAFMDGTALGTNTFPTIPPIGSVGLTQTALGAPNDVQWTNFSLTAVAPGGIPPYLYPPLPPASVSITNTTVTVNATAFGSAPMGYYWLNNATVLASGVTNTPVPSVPNNAAPIAANLSVPNSSLNLGQLQLVVTNAYGTNITTVVVTTPFTQVPIVPTVTNGTLYLTWPAADTGLQLQAQTNTVGKGIGNNWVNYNPSTGLHQVAIPVNLTNGTVFYRLTY
jgi:hypothetical protein